MFSGGLTYSFWEGSQLELGVASGKITKLRNPSIFNEREVTKLYGVEQGRRKHTVFGANLQVNIVPKYLTKHLVWENYTQLFIPNKNLVAIKYYTLDFNNAFHYIFLKHLRISVRTKINYDFQVQEKPQIINQFVFGFYLSNQIQ